MINRVILTGRLTRDPELRYTPDGVAVATFTLAVDRRGRSRSAEGEQQTDFIRCVAWRERAEFVSNYLTKGRLVGIEGRLQVRKWTGADGQPRTTTEVVADNISFLDKRPEEAPSGPAPAQATPPDTAPMAEQELPLTEEEMLGEGADEELPF